MKVMTNEALLRTNKEEELLAKPRHDLVMKYGKGELQICASTMNLLMFISPYVDLDLRVNISMVEVKTKLNMQYKTLHHALREARLNGLLVKNGKHYYSNFHVVTDGKSAKYQKLVAEYTSAAVLSYSLNTHRLFYYFVSRSFMGFSFKATIENLYDNRLHDNEFGISYFDDYVEMSNALFTLINNEQITVQLLEDEETGEGPILTHETANLEKQFHDFCGYDIEKKRKARTSKYKMGKHKIKVKVTKRVADAKLDVCASTKEFNEFAKKYDICFDEMSDKLKNTLISYKNELFAIAAETGLKIYRNSLERYFKENTGYVLANDVIIEKTANYVMDFYILKDIENILVGAALQPRVYKGKRLGVDALLCNGYLVDMKHIQGLLEFYRYNASSNHLILLDEKFESLKININNLIAVRGKFDYWDKLHKEIQIVYREGFSDSFKSLDMQEWRDIKRAWARESILSSQEEFAAAIAELYEKVTFTSTRRNRRKKEGLPITGPEDQSRISIPFYNWLDS